MARMGGNDSRLLQACSPDHLHCGNERYDGRTAEADQIKNCPEVKMKRWRRKPQYPCKRFWGEIKERKKNHPDGLFHCDAPKYNL